MMVSLHPRLPTNMIRVSPFKIPTHYIEVIENVFPVAARDKTIDEDKSLFENEKPVLRREHAFILAFTRLRLRIPSTLGMS